MRTMMKMPIYLDYAATTPVDERVAKVMATCLTQEGNFANPASRSHLFGWKAEEAVEDARNSVAELINCDSREVVWTSGATEANNLAIKGVVEALGAKREAPMHIITSAIEHKSVLDTCKYLEAFGVQVTYLKPMPNGIIEPAQVKNALTANTVLVSVMHVNNEIGVVNDIAGIGQICRDNKILFHVDAAQSLAKVAVDVAATQVDLMSMSAHKMYGPKGQGALYVRRHPDIKVISQIHGGGHERGMRSGTLATHQIAGFGEAAKIAKAQWQEDSEHLTVLRKNFIHSLSALPGVQFNGNAPVTAPGIINLSLAGVEGETLLTSLRDLALSSGSACNSVSIEPSYVLLALGLPRELAHSSLRISMGRFTTEHDVDSAAQKIIAAVTQLRERSSRRAG